MHYLRAFGAFWYDFLIGDRVELFLGPLAALLVTWLLLNAKVSSGFAALFLILAVLFVGASSLALATRPRR